MLLTSAIATALAPSLVFAQKPVTPATPEKMNQIYAEYWEENLQANPVLATNIGDNRFNDRFGAASSAEARATTKRIAEKYLARSCRFAAACDA